MSRFFNVSALGVLMLSVLAFAACSEDAPTEQTSKAAPTSTGPAAELRVKLNRLLDEHVYLAMDATDAALAGRNEEFKQAAVALDANSVELGGLITSAYGDTAGKAFLDGWRRHIGMFVDYTNGVAKQDQAAKTKAVADLNQYARELADLLNGANGLPKDAVVSLVGAHALALCSVIDAQGAGDRAAQYARTRVGADQVQQIGDPLAEATVLKFPEKFGGSPAAVSAK